MIYLYIIICAAVYAICGHDTMLGLGVCNDNMLGAFTYMFAHASFLHLAMNAFCLIMMYKPIYNLYSKRFGLVSSIRFLFISVFLSALSAFPAATDIPTIGASGLVFVLLGMLLVLNPTMKQLKGYAYVAAALAIQLYFGKSNVALHVCAFLTGALFIIFRIAYDRIRIHREE